MVILLDKILGLLMVLTRLCYLGNEITWLC